MQQQIFPCIDLKVTNASEKLSEYRAAFKELYTLYGSLFDMITDEGHYVFADPLRHPLIFYLAHTACFYINKLVISNILSPKERINPHFESLFAIGVDEMQWDDLTIIKEWPPLDKVKEYRQQVFNLVDNFLASRVKLSDNSEIGQDHPMWIITMGIEHEKIHLETTTMLIRQLPLKYIKKNLSLQNPFLNIYVNENVKLQEQYDNNLVEIPAGEVTIGRPMTQSHIVNDAHAVNLQSIYGWDNEFGFHHKKINSFKVSEKLISNGEFLKFVDEGGYSQRQFWSEEGWKWVTYTKNTFPKFWVKSENQYRLRLMLSETTYMPWDWPVEVNCFESNAYCCWLASKTGLPFRLMTEDEYYLLLKSIDFDGNIQKANLALKYGSPTPVDLHKTGKIYDAIGNVWQWTRTPIYPFNGFKCHPSYDDFTIPTFDDRHNLFKGGAWVSCGNLASPYSRYAFRRHFFQYAGFRLTVSEDFKDDNNPDKKEFESVNVMSGEAGGGVMSQNPYEQDAAVNLYCEFHWGDQVQFFGVLAPKFPVTIAMVCEQVAIQSDLWKLKKDGALKLSAMDLGCAEGRSAYEMTRIFDKVVGVDFSARFIQVATGLQQKGQMMYKIPIEGEIYNHKQASLSQLDNFEVESKFMEQLFQSEVDRKNYPVKIDKDHLLFRQGDACNLGSYLDGFHMVLAANLIDRLVNPQQFLKEIGKRIVPGGFLVICSPYTWLAEYTPKENWLGGKQVGGDNVFTKSGLEAELSEYFEPWTIKITGKGYQDPLYGLLTHGTNVKSFHLPFAIKETQRKHQFTYSEFTFWRRKQIAKE